MFHSMLALLQPKNMHVGASDRALLPTPSFNSSRRRSWYDKQNRMTSLLAPCPIQECAAILGSSMTALASSRDAPPTFRAKHIVKHFGGVHALRDVSIDLWLGEVHAIMGENGAGKSTFGKILAGAIPASSGTIEADGKGVTIRNPIDAQRLGITIIFQELDLFPNLSVAENIAIRNLAFPEGMVASRRKMNAFCQPHLERVQLAINPATLLGDLHLGHQQLVAIARALSMKARMIVFDESTSSLSDEFVENLFKVIASLRDSGVACIYISHKMDEIFRICDSLTVLRDGIYVDTCLATETDHAGLVRMMVGHGISGKAHSASHTTDMPLLKVSDLSTSQLRHIDFTLHQGEVLGLAGLVGAGRGELGQALFGLTRVTGGAMTLHGRPFAPRTPHQAIRQGLGLVPRDRKGQGLMMQMSVLENTTMAALSTITSGPGISAGGMIRRSAEANASHQVGTETRIRTAGPHAEINTLSGGNQQKALLGRWLLVDPEVYFFDDPTRGVDIGAKEDIYALIEQEAAKGKGILMVSSELSELMRCCDRILVLNQGVQVAMLDGRSTTSEEILHWATSTPGSRADRSEIAPTQHDHTDEA
jgi:ribose transport system ATP-binding protein